MPALKLHFQPKPILTGERSRVTKILVVDDETALCEMIHIFLSRCGYEVLKASSGDEALQKVKDDEPSLVLLGIKMPGLDGLETLRRIKQKGNSTTVIMLTAVADKNVKQKASDLGADDYIIKPVDLRDLQQSVQDAINRIAGQHRFPLKEEKL